MTQITAYCTYAYVYTQNDVENRMAVYVQIAILCRSQVSESATGYSEDVHASMHKSPSVVFNHWCKCISNYVRNY